MMEYKVSIIIPVYNKEKYLERCFNSVINQNYRNMEVIIVDDGSTDGSKGVVDIYSKKYGFKYYYKENGGLSSARNYGMKYANGDFVYFLDPDDEIKQDAIDTLVKKSDDYDIVIGNFQYLTETGRVINKTKIENLFIDSENMSTNEVYDYFYGRCYGISACNKLYRHSFIQSSGVLFQPNNEIYAEDLLFNLKLLAKKPRIAVINKQTYNYYQNKGSITKSYKPQFAERFANLINDYNSFQGSRKDVVCFTICNAVNSVSRQENTIKNIRNEVNKLLTRVNDYKSVINMKYINSVQSKRRIDIFILAFCIKKSIPLLCIYLKFKNMLIKE